MSSKGYTGAQSPLHEVHSGVALVFLLVCVELSSPGQELCTNPGFREGARARTAVPQLWEQKLKVAFSW